MHVVMQNLAVRVLLGERGALLFSRDTDLAFPDRNLLKIGEQQESRDAAVHLGIVEGAPSSASGW